ncbi:MAG TPA: hypothetical protein VFH45_02050 [Acidimicrobiales bacterium]|nr:hypothetical protein [Acidimicrobiales bacterium]
MALADGSEGCAAVDTSSGALVRAHYQGRAERPPAAFDVVEAVIGADPDGPDPTQPEAVVLDRPPSVVGRLRRRRARKLLAPLLLPAYEQPFGFPGSAVPYWEVPGDRPSLAVVAPERGPLIVRRSESGLGPACRFGWKGVDMELPLADSSAVRAFDEVSWPQLGGGRLSSVLGFDPRLLVLALSAPRHGRCYKVVAGLLPTP